MAKKKPNRRKTQKKEIEAKSNYEIKGILIIAIGLLTLIAIYSNLAGFLSTISQKISFVFLGLGAYLIPLYLIYLGYKYMAGRGKINVGVRFYGISTIIFTILLLLGTIFITRQLAPNDFGGNLSTLFKTSVEGKVSMHGGIIAYIISYLLYKFIGAIGSYIVYGVITIISLILIFNFSVVDTVSSAKSKRKERKNANKNKKMKAEDEEDFIKIERNNVKEQDEFIDKVNNKIKILDFMKNSNIDDYEDPEEEEVVYDNYIDNDLDKEIQEATMKNAKSYNEITDNADTKSEPKQVNSEEDVSKELDSGLISENNEEDKNEYIFPNTDLLKFNGKTKLNNSDKKDLLDSANKLTEILGNFGVDANVINISKGPSVTRFELQPSPGVKVSKIVNLADDIALGLAASGVRIEAPIPGKAAVGIEVPNKKQTAVFLREVLDSKEFKNTNKKLAFALGKDIGGECVVGDLSKMPHTLIAGATGSGKSVCINSLIISILYKYSPDEVKLLMVDPKVVELNVYNGIPHLLIPVVTDPKKAAAALNWAVNEMTKRYNLFAENGVRNIDSYNALFEKGKIESKLPFIIIIVDELADLMMVCPNDVEDYIGRLAQMARAAGMHLVIATQRPSVDVITGVIKANIPSRISFAVSSQVDSRTILDSAGAEKLLGKGDMLYYPVGEAKPLRVQGCFISEEEVENVVQFIKNDSKEAEYEDEIIEHINNEAGGKYVEDGEEIDELLSEAVNIVVEFQQASTSFLQRRLRIGFNRASRIMDQLEDRGVISPRDGSKPRTVLMKKEDLLENSVGE
ncbi:MAG: DNA translocase FtsK [Clostridiales bacterium]|nr:DNA translocase FtsK [Clostridiales bacterium]